MPVGCLAAALTLGGCAIPAEPSSSPQIGPTVALRIPAYSAAPGGALSNATQRTFAVEPARDARSGLQPAGRIGEETDVGGKFVAHVSTRPPPAQLLQDVFSAELGAAGLRASADNPDIRITPEIRRFEIATPTTLFHSDVNVAIDVGVSLEAPPHPGRSTRYASQCTRRAGMWSGVTVDFMTEVVADCLKQIGEQFRRDAAVRDLLNRTGAQR